MFIFFQLFLIYLNLICLFFNSNLLQYLFVNLIDFISHLISYLTILRIFNIFYFLHFSIQMLILVLNGIFTTLIVFLNLFPLFLLRFESVLLFKIYEFLILIQACYFKKLKYAF